MDHDQILNNIARHISLDPEESQIFLSMLIPRTFRRKADVLREGEVARYTNYVVRGCLREYNIDKQGKLHIDFIAPENYWITDLYSFLTQTPSHQNIDALEDTDVLQLSKPDLDKLYIKVPKFERLNRILYQNSLVAHHQRLMANISGSAKDRYTHFRSKYPGLEQRIPQKQIAAYLGITPEYLSMLKKKINKG